MTEPTKYRRQHEHARIAELERENAELRGHSEQWQRLRELIGFYLRQSLASQTDLTLYRRHFEELTKLLDLHY